MRITSFPSTFWGVGIPFPGPSPKRPREDALPDDQPCQHWCGTTFQGEFFNQPVCHELYFVTLGSPNIAKYVGFMNAAHKDAVELLLYIGRVG